MLGPISQTGLERARSEFPFLERRAYSNHGSIAPLSVSVRAAIHKGIECLAMGTLGRSIWRSTIAPLREKIARLINATPDEIFIMRNTAEGISTVAAGVDIGPPVITVTP